MIPNLASHPGVAKSLQERWAQLRSHKRVISKVKLLVEWDEGSAPRQANAVTVDISHSGCMAVVGADLPLHRRGRMIFSRRRPAGGAGGGLRGAPAWGVGPGPGE